MANRIDWQEGRASTGWRGDIGIPELALVIRNVKRTRKPGRLAEDFIDLGWPEDQAHELARIVARVSEVALA